MEYSCVNNGLYRNKLSESESIITFFTPTYNRCKLVNRVYSSLLNQTRNDFVWILVNDGSSDETESIAIELLKREEIPMLFISKPNGGKHSAFKVALEAAETRFFMCMDDDDLYSEKSVEVLLSEWQRIDDEHRNDIGAIRTLTFDSDRNAVISKPELKESQLGGRYDVSSLDMIYRERIIQENWTCYITKALKEINLFGSYWMSEQHKFFSEGIWQARFARIFLCRYYYVVLRTYCRDTETSLSRAVKSRQHYLDMFINSKLSIDEMYDYLLLKKIEFFKTALIISILRRWLGIPFGDLIRNTDKGFLKGLYYVLYPIGYLVKKPDFI